VPRAGGARKVAEKIGAAVMSPAHPVGYPLDPPVDLLFLGVCSIGAGVAGPLAEFIDSLSPEDVKKVSVFGTCAFRSPVKRISGLLRGKGFDVSQSSYCCFENYGLLHRGRPSEADLREAAAYAKSQVKHGFFL
jgi:hypothetical protein